MCVDQNISIGGARDSDIYVIYICHVTHMHKCQIPDTSQMHVRIKIESINTCKIQIIK